MLGITAAFMITFVLGVVLRSRAHEMKGGDDRGSRSPDKKFTSRDGFLWAACASLFASGTLAVGTFIGDIIGAFTGLAVWIGWCIAIVLVLGIWKDLWNDREPDKVAPWFLFFLPPVTNGLPGEFGQLLQRMWNSYGDAAQGLISRIFGV